MMASRNPRFYQRWIAVAEAATIKAYLHSEASDDPASRQSSILPVCIVHGCALNMVGAMRTVASLKRAFGPDVAIWTQGQALPGCMLFPQQDGASAAQALCDVAAHVGVDAWLVPVRAGDVLAPCTGPALDHGIHRHPTARIFYWDSDDIRGNRRCAPWIKGGWDPILHLSRDMLGRHCALHIATAIATAPTVDRLCATFDMFVTGALASAMIVDGKTAPPVHIPLILTHCAEGDGDPRWPVLMERLFPNHVSRSHRGPHGFHVVCMADPEQWPSVSIIIPTKDKFHLISACLTSLAMLDYRGRHEIIVVDNGSTEEDALAFLAEQEKAGNIRVIRDNGAFNFSALNNNAVAQSSGQILCLLNNDVEAVDGDWLETMVRHAMRPEVGAVGALLLYPDGSVQHAGVSIGTGGAAGHLARGARPDDPQHYAWHAVTRTVSAVTAACLVVRRDAYLAVGGLDAESFAVAFNDVDFCLKLQELGLHNIFVAQARLIHHESVSRGQDMDPVNIDRFSGELRRFQEKWNSLNYEDPHYSDLFSRSCEPCIMKF